MRYLPPFDVLRRDVNTTTVRGKTHVSLSYDAFLGVIRRVLATVNVDEAWYARQYPDIARAIQAGNVASGRNHFIEDGYFEGRMPFPVRVDERWYLEQNPDVARDVAARRVASAQAHFDANGYREGRLPFP